MPLPFNSKVSSYDKKLSDKKFGSRDPLKQWDSGVSSNRLRKGSLRSHWVKPKFIVLLTDRLAVSYSGGGANVVLSRNPAKHPS